MAKQSKRRGKAKADGAGSKSVRRLERRLDQLATEQRALRKRVKRLTRALEAPPAPPPFPPFPPFAPGPGGPGGRWGKRGGPPRARALGPVVSLEVPLETDDPSAPLWATVAARLPEEIATVGDDGRVHRYRYSAVGSTPQAPRYRRLAEPPAPPPPGPGATFGG